MSAPVILLLSGTLALHYWWRRRYALAQDETFRLKREARLAAEAHDRTQENTETARADLPV